jgi:hypothetical protein
MITDVNYQSMIPINCTNDRSRYVDYRLADRQIIKLECLHCIVNHLKATIVNVLTTTTITGPIAFAVDEPLLTKDIEHVPIIDQTDRQIDITSLNQSEIITDQSTEKLKSIIE